MVLAHVLSELAKIFYKIGCVSDCNDGATVKIDQCDTAANSIAGLPDILAKGLDVVFCGINPGLQSAVQGYHFATRSNRFWRVLHRSGFTPEQMRPENAGSLLDYGCGLTSAVERPTVSANDLKRNEFIEGSSRLARKIERFGPRYLAFLGKPACAAIFNQRTISWGRQSMRFGGAAVWVLPNPSGLNRAFTLDALVSAYGELHESLITNKD